MTQSNIYVLPERKNAPQGGSSATSGTTAETLSFADFDKIQLGDEFRFSKLISEADVEAFARLSGDRNPLHMDDAFAARTHFQRRVVHGMLVANYVSTMIGMQCPGPGALWGQQSFRWLAPVFIGDSIQLTLKVAHKSLGSRALKVEVKAANQEGKVVMEGEGTVTALEERQKTGELPISERVAFVSGAARGVGAAIATALAEAGAMVVVNYRRNEAAANELCSKIQSRGGKAVAVQADVADAAAVSSAMQQGSESFGRPVSILVNNAGTLPEPRSFTQTTWAEIQSTFDVHVRGAFHCCQAAIPGMIELKSGRIINIGSAFLRGLPQANWTNFLLAKSALQAMTRCLAAELGPHGIQVNMVSPALVETESISGLSERLRKVQAMQTPLRRLASPQDIAAVVSALCSGAGNFITGADIPVNGGLQM